MNAGDWQFNFANPEAGSFVADSDIMHGAEVSSKKEWSPQSVHYGELVDQVLACHGELDQPRAVGADVVLLDVLQPWALQALAKNVLRQPVKVLFPDQGDFSTSIIRAECVLAIKSHIDFQ